MSIELLLFFEKFLLFFEFIFYKKNPDISSHFCLMPGHLNYLILSSSAGSIATETFFQDAFFRGILCICNAPLRMTYTCFVNRHRCWNKFSMTWDFALQARKLKLAFKTWSRTQHNKNQNNPRKVPAWKKFCREHSDRSLFSGRVLPGDTLHFEMVTCAWLMLVLLTGIDAETSSAWRGS